MATFGGLTPYLHYEDAEAALDWLARVFGFDEIARYVDGDGRVREAEMHVGDAELWICGHDPGYWTGKGSRPEQLVIVWVEDVDALHARVTAAGVDAPAPVDKPYDVRTFGVADPEGYEWGFMRRLGKGYQPTEEGGLREVRPAAS
jgi:uncharacterized glyoxalase superfamily protein PhnB